MNSFVFHSSNVTPDNRKFFTYQLVDYSSTETKYALSVASGDQLGKDNKLIDLSASKEFELMMYQKDTIQKLRAEKTKFIFVIDITNFPYIGCNFDLRDPTINASQDQFDKDLTTQWNNYSHDKVLTIVVNLHLPHTGLKVIAFK
jgi:hypothetical protein